MIMMMASNHIASTCFIYLIENRGPFRLSSQDSPLRIPPSTTTSRAATAAASLGFRFNEFICNRPGVQVMPLTNRFAQRSNIDQHTLTDIKRAFFRPLLHHIVLAAKHITHTLSMPICIVVGASPPYVLSVCLSNGSEVARKAVARIKILHGGQFNIVAGPGRSEARIKYRGFGPLLSGHQ